MIIKKSKTIKHRKRILTNEQMLADLLRHCNLKIENWSKKDEELVAHAFWYGEAAHRGQYRKSGEPYWVHPVLSAKIIAGIDVPAILVAATLLHDVPEDTDKSVEDIRKEFGNEMASLTAAMEKLGTVKYHGEERQVENLRKLFLAFAKDIRVVVIKLADRLHNMSTLQFVRPDKQHRIARETLEIYASLADRLGIGYFKLALEHECFRILFPAEFKIIANKLKHRHSLDTKKLAYAKDELEVLLYDMQNTIFARIKSPYSLFKKMQNKNLEMEIIHDYLACRVIVNNEADCYEVLSRVHKRWEAVDGRLKDYIAQPKNNGYRSLHTCIWTNRLAKNEMIEIQIRTQEMNEEAEHGIASHWHYAEKKSARNMTREQIRWIEELANVQTGSTGFFDTLRNDFFADRIFIFTPKGEVKDLPIGSTPIDFAYSVHSKVGDHCIGANVNGKYVPLRTRLNNGDSVEIKTRENATPSREWIDFTKTHQAQNRVRHWLRAQHKDSLREDGEKLIRAAAERWEITQNIFTDEKLQQKALDKFRYSNWEALLAAIGEGELSSNKILRACGIIKNEAPTHKIQPKTDNKINLVTLKIEGIRGLASKICGHCHPHNTGTLVGYITNIHGVTIHEKTCSMLQKLDTRRFLKVEE